MARTDYADIARALYESLKNKEGDELNKVIENSIKLLSDKRILHASDSIIQKVQELKDRDEGVVRTQVFSARGLNDSMRKEIKKSLANRYQSNQVVLHEHINPEMISGIRIEIGEDVIDLSLKNKMTQLHDYLITN